MGMNGAIQHLQSGLQNLPSMASKPSRGTNLATQVSVDVAAV